MRASLNRLVLFVLLALPAGGLRRLAELLARGRQLGALLLSADAGLFQLGAELLACGAVLLSASACLGQRLVERGELETGRNRGKARSVLLISE